MLSQPGSAVALRLFVETGPGRERLVGEQVSPPASTWSCLLDLAAPAAAQPGADPAQVVAMGVEIIAAGDARAQLDTIAY